MQNKEGCFFSIPGKKADKSSGQKHASLHMRKKFPQGNTHKSADKHVSAKNPKGKIGNRSLACFDKRMHKNIPLKYKNWLRYTL